MRLTIGRKLQLGFAAVILIMTTLIVFGLVRVYQFQAMMEEMYQNQTMGISLVKEANLSMMYRNWTEKNMILASDPAEIAAREQEISRFEAGMKDLMRQAKPRLQGEGAMQAFSVYEEAWKELDGIHARILGHARRNEDGQALEWEAKAIDPLTRVTTAIVTISQD